MAAQANITLTYCYAHHYDYKMISIRHLMIEKSFS